MPNDENIIFSGFESGFVESFIIGEEKRYVKEILKKLPVLNNDIINTLNDLDNIDELIIFANYNFNYKLHNKTDFKYDFLKKDVYYLENIISELVQDSYNFNLSKVDIIVSE